MNELYFITGNENKLKEAKEIMPEIKGLNMDLLEIQDINPHKIIKHKVEEARKQVPGRFIVEDVSFYLEAINGLPGPLIKWFLKTIGVEGIVKIAKTSSTINLPGTCFLASSTLCFIILWGFISCISNKSIFNPFISGIISFASFSLFSLPVIKYNSFILPAQRHEDSSPLCLLALFLQILLSSRILLCCVLLHSSFLISVLLKMVLLLLQQFLNMELMLLLLLGCILHLFLLLVFGFLSCLLQMMRFLYIFCIFFLLSLLQFQDFHLFLLMTVTA